MKILLTITFIYTTIFACGGCVDSENANIGAENIIQTYDNKDSEVANVFKEINKILKKMNNNEKEILNNFNNTKNISIENELKVKSILFKTNKIVEIKKRRK